MKVGRKNEQILFQRIRQRDILNYIKYYQIRLWYQESQKMDPLFLQVFKFYPTTQIFKWRRSIAFASFIIGFHTYLAVSKVFIDDHYVRERGSVVPYEYPFYYSLWRILKVRIHMWIVSNFFLFSKMGEGTEYPKGQLAPYNIYKMRLLQWEYYVKRRDDSFDFLMIGESEHIPLD